MKPRNYYAGHSYMGINMSYHAPCWTVHVFGTKQQRDAWVDKHCYDGNNYVACAITRNMARAIGIPLIIHSANEDTATCVDSEFFN